MAKVWTVVEFCELMKWGGSWFAETQKIIFRFLCLYRLVLTAEPQRAGSFRGDIMRRNKNPPHVISKEERLRNLLTEEKISHYAALRSK